MAVITLRAPLRERTGGVAQHRLSGASVVEALKELERRYPQVVGWILDERGRVRPNVNVFVNGEQMGQDVPLASDDVVQVLPSIAGGVDMTELLVGTKKGLFVLRGEPSQRRPFALAARAFPGDVVEFGVRDPRSGRYFASVTSGPYGPRLMYTDDPAGAWQQAIGPAFPPEADASVERIWVVSPGEVDGLLYAGVDPAALFVSTDDGASWSLNEALWKERHVGDWQPGLGGLALHSICPWPGDPQRLAVGISAAGVWITEDGGASWRTGFPGLVPLYLPEEARANTNVLCVHNMHRAPANAQRLFMQFHGSVYRSDDEGATWTDIAHGLPSGFGFPLIDRPIRSR